MLKMIHIHEIEWGMPRNISREIYNRQREYAVRVILPAVRIVVFAASGLVILYEMGVALQQPW